MRQPDLSPVEWATLRAVALYRFVNVELLHRVVPGTRGTIRNAARKLFRLKLVGSTGQDLAAEPDEPREIGTPHLFWLSVKGANFMHRHGDGWAIGATRRPKTEKEVEHRLGIVAVHIAFRAWAVATGKRDVSFLTDFEPGSRLREKVTGLPYTVTLRTKAGPVELQRLYVPDGFARFRLPAEGAPMQLMVLEFERGGARADLSKFFGPKNRTPPGGKLGGIWFAAENNLVERGKGQTRACPYLIVFGTEKARKSGLAAWPDPGAAAWRRFFVTSLPMLEAAGADFSRVWTDVRGEPRTLFAAEPGAAASSSSALAPP